MSVRDVLIVGAGPSGLATAIAAKQQGLDYVIVEKGVLVDAIFNFPTNMVFFTTPELLEIGGLPLVTPYDKPTRLEALRYYRRVVDTYGLQVSFDERVIEIEREDGVFVVTTEKTAPEPGGSAAQDPPYVPHYVPHPDEGAASGTPRRPGAAERTRHIQVRHARAVVLAIGSLKASGYHSGDRLDDD